MYIFLLLKMINGFSRPAKIMASPFKIQPFTVGLWGGAYLILTGKQTNKQTKQNKWNNMKQLLSPSGPIIFPGANLRHRNNRPSSWTCEIPFVALAIHSLFIIIVCLFVFVWESTNTPARFRPTALYPRLYPVPTMIHEYSYSRPCRDVLACRPKSTCAAVPSASFTILLTLDRVTPTRPWYQYTSLHTIWRIHMTASVYTHTWLRGVRYSFHTDCMNEPHTHTHTHTFVQMTVYILRVWKCMGMKKTGYENERVWNVRILIL